MAYSEPTSRSTGFLVTAAVWNQDVVSNVSFLANPPACRVYNSISQNIANNADVALTFDSERFDTDSMHSTSSNTGRITINTAGVYVVTFSGIWPSDTTWQRTLCSIRLNGSTVISYSDAYFWATGSAGPPTMNVTTIYKFAAADYIEAMVFQQNSGAATKAVIAAGNYSPEFAAGWIGRG